MLNIQCKKETLLEPLVSVSGIVERRHTLPILSNILIKKSGDTLSFLATDIEIQISTEIKIDKKGDDGSLTVSSRKMLDIIKSLPENSDVNLIQEEKRVLIKSGRSKFFLQTLPSADFPLMELDQTESEKIKFNQKDLKELILKNQYAMAIQDVRYYLNGLFFILNENEVKIVATDGHRLCFSRKETTTQSNKVEIIIPRKTIIELSRLLNQGSESVELNISKNQVEFIFSSIKLVSKLIEGKFPDYERVIPVTLKNEFKMNRLLLLQAMQRASILTSDKFKGVRLLLEKDTLKIVAANTEQEEAQEEIEINYDGQNLDVGFNVGYLIDVLTNLQSEEILWGFNDSNSSSLIRLPENDDFKYVVMPMRI